MADAALKEFETKMDKCIDYFREELATIRAGRANPAILNKVTVEYYGTPTPVAQVGNISVPEPHTLLIQPWDASILGDLEKAIQKSDIGVMPQSDGKVIRINFPPLTEERRKEFAKTMRKMAEDAKVHVRGVRRDAIEAFKKQQKNKEITEDDLKGIEDDIQKLTDKKVKDIDGILAVKEKEILEV